MGISQSIENNMDGKDDQRGSIETDGTGREILRQFKTRKLQYLGPLARQNSSQLQLIEGQIKAEDPVADEEIPGQLI